MMGITYIEGLVRGTHGKEATVDFLVDSGAVYSLLPKRVWESIDLSPERRMTFRLADGTQIERSMSECYIVLPQGKSHTPVILGEEGDDEALLGVVTLENIGLVFNPMSRTLQPMRIVLI